MTIISDDSYSVIQDPIFNPNPINPAAPNPNKRKRNQPRAPDPDSEVIALSPKSLMATNRFVCEICKKGFQRDQNLQLHRRGHNLPWKLKRSDKESITKKKVYVCPENTCVHHHPCRALGDLTGIKKHYSRKHGEKKWKCHKCSKKYAVQSDWKVHTKICGTREYKCDCGTIFSRKDSFNTHRAFCDAISIQATTIIPTPNLINYRADVMSTNLQTDHGIGINNYYCRHELIDNIPINNIGLSNYWPSSLASPALMFPVNMALKEEEYYTVISSNTLHAAESCYYYGNVSTSNFMSSSSSQSATAQLQKAVQMGSSSTTTTTPNNDSSSNNKISSTFCNSMGKGDDEQRQEENLKLLTAYNNVMMVSNGNKNIINGFVFDGADGRNNYYNSPTPNPFHEAFDDRSTTRDFLGSGGWPTFDMANIGSLAPASALSGGHKGFDH